MNRLALWGSLVVSLVPSVAQAEALSWLQRMNQAVAQTTYEGTAVYRDQSEMRTLKILHRYQDGKEHERMLALSGEQREIVREDSDVTCILPDQQSVVVEHQGVPGLFPKLSRTAFEKLGETYDLILVAQQQRVAGRMCQPVQVRARDIYRYDYSICLDTETALPLDIQLLDERGQLLEQVLFTDIQFPASIADAQLKPQQDISEFVRLDSRPELQAHDGHERPDAFWELQSLPAGFRLATREHGHWPGFEGPVTQLLYSDGLATVSIFATQSAIPDEAMQGVRQFGGVNAYGRMVAGHHIMVIGGVPPATLQFFGDNLQLAKLD